MGYGIAYVFGYLLILFLFLLLLNFTWDRWLRPWLFKDKIEGVTEEATEEYVERKVHETLEKTLHPQPRRSKDAGKK